MEPGIFKALALIALWMGVTFGLQAQTVVEYIHTDALGTPVAITNAAGTVIERSVYEPNGQLINRPLTDGPGFTGHVQDAATGLTYMQQRYYDPTIGRFLSVDPVTANNGTGANFNRYWYANNNPYKLTDPDGRAPCIMGRSTGGGCNNNPAGPRPGDPGGACDLRPCGNSFAAVGDGGDSSSSKDPIVDLESVEVTFDAADVGLSAHALFLPNKMGDWAQGNMGISRWEGLSPADLKRVRSVAKVGSAVSYLTIGMSAYDFQQAVRERDGYGMVNSGADLGFGLYGLTGPVGAAAAAGYGGMSLLLEIPAVYDHTVTPFVDAACWATSNC